MSTDTDYVITIKGKDAALRKAAADFIALSLSPWNPTRDDKKTLTRLDVFRNESNCAGFFAPSSLCEEAAKLFPGANVSFSSKNEYGYTEEGAWVERGSPPIDVSATVVEKVFERVQAEVDKPEARISWLEPLVEWGAANPIPSAVIDAIRGALEAAEIAAKKVAAAREAEAELESQKEVEAVQAFQSLTKWIFHPVLTVDSQRLGELGQPAVWRLSSGPLEDEQSGWGEVWDSIEAGEVDAYLETSFGERFTQRLAVAFPIRTDSRTASKFLNDLFDGGHNLIRMRESPKGKDYEWLRSKYTARVFARTSSTILVGAEIIKHGSSFILLSNFYYSNETEKSEIKKYFHLAKFVQSASVWGIVNENTLAPDNQSFGQDIMTGCLAAHEGRVFLATSSTPNMNAPTGRIASLSLADGSVEWTSETAFNRCGDLITANDSTLLALCIGHDNQPQLVSIESSTGRELWRVPIDYPSNCIFRLAASSETVVLSAGEYGKAHISFRKLISGEKIADKTFQEASSPKVVMDGLRVYVADCQWAAAFTHDGENSWTVYFPQADTCSVALSGNNTLLLSLGNKGIACLRCENGSVVWSVEEYSYGDPCVVGAGQVAFFASRKEVEMPDYIKYCGMCSARNIKNGALVWQAETPEPGHHPLVVTDTAVLTSGLECLDISSGAKLGSWGFSLKSGIMAPDGTLVSIGSSWLGTYQMACLDNVIGQPSGPWPMGRQGPGNAAFLLRLEQKQGYKQFIKAWKDGEDLSHRLAKFAPDPDSDKARVARIHGIIRGHELTAQARSWVEPSIGSGKTATARGAQWRLVMAYGGFELLAKSLAGAKDRGLDEKAVDSLIGKLALPMFEPLAPPPIDKSSLKVWMDEEDASDVLDFLKMDKGDRNRFDAWLGKQKPTTEWTDALLLAKAFRNATAHGALSPTKLEEWKLGEAIARLTEEIFRIDEAVFEVLGYLEVS
jgi:outer membrane protein assembly factor BamB